MGGRCDQFNSLAMHSYTFNRSPIEFRWFFAHKSLDIFPINYLGILSLKYVYDFLMWHDCKKSSRTQRWNSMTEDDVLQYAMDKVRKKIYRTNTNTHQHTITTVIIILSYPIPMHTCVRKSKSEDERTAKNRRAPNPYLMFSHCSYKQRPNERVSEWKLNFTVRLWLRRLLLLLLLLSLAAVVFVTDG